MGFTEGEETHRQLPSAEYVRSLGDDENIGGDDDDEDVTDHNLSPRAITEYEEITIGGGRKLADGVSLGFYYTISEASHQTISGGQTVTEPQADADDDEDVADTPGSVDDFVVTQNSDEVNSLGITLVFRF
jgi:hypothetical protein